MIIQTGNRTDIPAFYSEWFANRLKEGYVCVRNPFNPQSVTRYTLNPSVVDLLVFCSKNPAPMLSHMALLKPYHQYWFVTITPYGKDIEPHVPEKSLVMQTFHQLSAIVGPDCMCWRYDPIMVDENWSVDRHIETFRKMCKALAGSTYTAVISFIDLYENVKRNFPEARTVPFRTQLDLTSAFVQIGREYGMSAVVYNSDEMNSSARWQWNAGLEWGSGIIHVQENEYPETCGGSNKVTLTGDRVSEDGTYTVYGHMKAIHVQEGKSVKKCEEIGEVGDIASLNGIKLYFQVSEGTQTVDPLQWLKQR